MVYVSGDMAEVLGVLLGDGCRSRFKTPRGWVELVLFTGNSNEIDYYQGFLQPTMRREFRVEGYIRLRPDDNTVRYFVQCRGLNRFLDSMCIPIGRRRDAAIPDEVLRDQELRIRFVRGFYHAEGSVYRRYSRKYSSHSRVYSHLLCIQIRTKLATLMRQLHAVVNELGIHTTRLVDSNGVFTFRITSQIEIQKFFRMIGPRLKTTPRTG